MNTAKKPVVSLFLLCPELASVSKLSPVQLYINYMYIV